MADAPKRSKERRRAKRTVSVGQMHVLATFNNTIVSFTDSAGGLLTASSAGSCGFRGSKKGTAYAAQIAAEKAAQAARSSYGLSKLDVYVRGTGLGRESAVRALATMGFSIESIRDRTPIPHGGVRPRKPRRV